MNYKSHAFTTLRLALPLIIGQLSQMLLGLVDTVMVGELGVTSLASLTLANIIFWLPFVLSIGILTSVSVLSSNAHGAQDLSAARHTCHQGLWLGTLLGLGVTIIGLLAMPLLHLLNQPPEITAGAKVYLIIIMISSIPGLASMALKNHADALNRPWPPFWIFLSGVVLNIILNYLLIYGHAGFPNLGLAGAAWATLIARICILVAMLYWLRYGANLSAWIPEKWFALPTFHGLSKLTKLGFPAGCQMLCECSAFSIAGLLISHFGAVSLAAHQIAITLASTAFMIPLGLAMALTVRIGEAHGAKNYAALRPIALSGTLLATLFSSVNALVMLLGGHWLASLFIQDHAVITLTATLLTIVGLLQLVDGLQATFAGMLRGLQDTRLPALMGIISYWVIGIPAAALLAFTFHMKSPGVWYGMAAGLTAAALTLGRRLYRKLPHHTKE